MATDARIPLTPKIRELVAVDRQGRPPVGRLTPAQVELLSMVARGRQEFDESVSAPRAIVALAKGRPVAAMPILDEVLSDPDAPSPNRVAAARGLGVVSTPAAEALLLRSGRDRDPRVQQAVFAALGWFGSPDVASELGKIRPADEHARRQLEFARALAVHRHGLPGPFLGEAPARRSRLTVRSKTTAVSLGAKTAAATKGDLAKVQGPLYGIDAASRGYSLRCGRREWTVFVNRQLGRSFSAPTRLTDRAWIAAVACWWYPIRTIAMPQYVVLTRPIDDTARIDVVRSDGEIVYVGTAELRGATTAFSIAEVERAATAPLRLAGRLTPKGVELDVALAGPRRVGTPDTEPASAA